jgi:hypothetical protein
MPREQSQHFRWPGILGMEEFSYTVSHGIQPSTAQIVTFPNAGGAGKPEVYGDLSFSDGQTPILLRNARAHDIFGDVSKAGTTWTVHVEDRRWKWRGVWGGFGGVRGRFNRSDTRGKLVPWSIRSPKELASMLLDELGETGYVVTLPDGLDKSFGADIDRYLRLGENFPATMTNPFFDWDHTPPGDALAQLCDHFGCVIVYQPIADRIIIAPIGEGLGELPNLPCEVIAPSVTSNTAPRAMGVFGAAIRIQARFLLEPVGEEWDGSILPIDQLSYAPKGGPTQPQVIAVGYVGDPGDNPVPALSVTVEWGDQSAGGSWNAEGTYAAALADLAAQLNADPAFSAAFTASVDGTELVITPNDPATEYTVSMAASWPGTFPAPAPEGFAGRWQQRMRQARKEPGRTWAACPPPHFRMVEATNRLSKMEAVALAAKSVFKYYRIRFVDPETEKPPLTLPWYGKLKRVQQVVLQPTKPEQVKPLPRIEGGVNKGNPIGVTGAGALPGQGVLPEYYNGVSRDRLATVTGSIWKRIGEVYLECPRRRASRSTTTRKRRTACSWAGA